LIRLEKLNEVITELISIYDRNGYVTEDQVLVSVIDNNIPLEQVDSICDTILSKGILIHDGMYNSEVDEQITDQSRTNYDALFNKVIEIDPTLNIFIEEIRKIKAPQRKEFSNLIIQAKNNNEFAKNRIISMYLRNAVKQALLHHEKFSTPLGETIQEACYGLVLALDEYEVDINTSFMSFASLWIRQVLQRELPINDLSIYIPMFIKEQLFKIAQFVDEYNENYDGFNVSKSLINRIVNELNFKYDKAESLLKLINSQLYINEIPNQYIKSILSDDSSEHIIFESIHNYELAIALDGILSTLKEREAKVILLRFGFIFNEAYTLEDIGEKFNVTRERIRQIEVKALRRLRHPRNAKKLRGFL
jgi:RNA polymerase primary sigma factor